MATYYWVGGSGNWDAATTTNWASSSGGAGGAGVPTSVDDVIFDAASNATAYTVTVGADAVCQDITVAGPLVGNVTFSLATTSRLNCFGSFTLPATGAVWTGTGAAAINFLATSTGKTITTNGVTLTVTAIVFNGVGGEWTLGSALSTNLAGNLTVTNGSFNTGNYNITVAVFNSNNSNVRSINLGSSTVTFSGTSNSWNFAVSTNLTFNAGTSTITTSSASVTSFQGGSQTYYNVSFTSTSIGNITFTGANTFNDLTFAARAAAGIGNLNIGADQTINGTLTLGSGTTGVARLFVRSDIVGTPRTLTVATLAAPTDIDFRDIVAAGASSPWSGTRIGNCLGNSNITFDASRTVYWNSAASGNWNGAVWSTASGNTGGAAINLPLAQDTIDIDDAGLTAGNTITLNAAYNIPTLSFANRTTAMTFATGTTTPNFYGNLTLDADVTYTGTGLWTFAGQGITQAITSAGKTLTQPITINAPTGTVQLLDNLTLGSTLTTTLTAGTLDLSSGNRTLSTGLFASNNSNVRSVAFGTGKITLTGNGAGVWDFRTATNFTYTGTSNVEFTYAGAVGTRIIRHGDTAGGSETNAISIRVTAGTDAVSFTSQAFIKDADFTGYSGAMTPTITLYGNLTFSSTQTIAAGNTGLTIAGTSGTQQITMNGLTYDRNIVFNGVGGTFAFQDAFTQGSTKTFTVTNGSVQLKNGVTSTVGAFATSGTNQKFLQSTTPGSQATLSQASGTVDASYLTIRDINATGGATWNAFVNQQNIDAGNNDGWDFGISPIVGSYEYTYQLRSFTQPRRF